MAIVLSVSDAVLIRDRDRWFGSSWERMRLALLREVQGKPFDEGLIERCGAAVRRIQELEQMEDEAGVDLHDFLPENRLDTPHPPC